MIPTDLEPNGQTDLGEEQHGVFTPGLMRAQDLGQASTPSIAKRSALKQYVIVGAVVAAGVAVLVFLRQQGVGADLLFADTPKIDYNLDQPVDEQAEARQRKVLDDLAVADGPVQVPGEELENNPFRLAQITQDDEPIADDAPAAVKPVKPAGPSPEEIRLAELDRLFTTLNLNTVIAGRISLARINGQTFRVGDVVAGEFTIKEITADRTVILAADGYEYILEMATR